MADWRGSQRASLMLGVSIALWTANFIFGTTPPLTTCAGQAPLHSGRSARSLRLSAGARARAQSGGGQRRPRQQQLRRCGTLQRGVFRPLDRVIEMGYKLLVLAGTARRSNARIEGLGAQALRAMVFAAAAGR